MSSDDESDRDPLSFFSARFDAARALREAARVRVPVRVKPFAYLDRCRYLLPPDDALHLVPPASRPSKEAPSGASTTTTTTTTLATTTATAPPDAAAESVVRLSVSNTLHDMMAPLTAGRFALLSLLRDERAPVLVTLHPDERGVLLSYTGTLELFDRRGNVVLVDALELPTRRVVPHVLLSGQRVQSVVRKPAV